MRLTLLLMMMLAATLALAYSSGPPNGMTGAPGEGNCTQCHNTYALDSGAGGLALSAGRGEYVPEGVYTVLIELADPAAIRWGFELTFLDAVGNPAGMLELLDAHTQVHTAGGRQYGKQTQAGSQFGQTGSVSWTMKWTAPPEGAGAVSLYAMGNAANGNGLSSGDYIYSFSTTFDEGMGTGLDEPAIFARLDANYPNPFNPRTSIPYTLDEGRWVRLSVYDSSGRLVKVLEEGPRGAGLHEAIWAGLDERGRRQPSGLYLARLTGEGGEDLAPARKMLLGK